MPGRELAGVHFAMEYLTQQNSRCAGDAIRTSQFITATDKHVIIIGGGDTGADCLGTAHRQGAQVGAPARAAAAAAGDRAADNPWPQWPNIFRVSSAHEEGGERVYSVATAAVPRRDTAACAPLHRVSVEPVKEDGRLTFKPVPGSEFELPPTSSCWRWASSAPSGRASRRARRELTTRGNVGATPAG